MKLPTVILPSLPPLFKSRKYWAAIIGVLVSGIVAYIPELEAVQSEMILFCTVIFGLVIHGYAEEDKAIAAQTGKRHPKYDPKVTAADFQKVIEP